MSKLRPGRFFEDFHLGQTLVHATPRTITDGDAALYIGLTGARHLPHSSDPTARALGYRGRTIDDLLAFHIAFGKTVPDISQNAIANLGYAEARFLAPVYPGDTLHTVSEVIGLKQNSNGKSGIVYVRSVASNQLEQQVLTWVRWVMVHKKDQSKPAPATVIPQLQASVVPEALAVPSYLNPGGLTPELTGSNDYWEDYAIGERIDHPSGMTLDESDHTLATKLYQNTAHVHFDATTTQYQRRLVYGGHVISMCRALSYDGLENVISIAAINSGSHANPVFAGDTLYAITEVRDKYSLSPDLGALRVRLIGIKNIPAASMREIKMPDGKHDPAVVLDLDYTVLMPKKKTQGAAR